MTRFIIVRHGETHWNVASRIQGHTDSELTATGQRQADALARRLERESFDSMVSSDLGRALTTARIIAARTRHDPVVADPLSGGSRVWATTLTTNTTKALTPERERSFRSLRS